MRQGDGSDLLGPGDPRNSNIGILYVEARDSRQEILTAISTQELQGRKQIAIVLPEQGKAFRQPLDFDGLKNMRRQLKAQLIFIASSGPGPAEFARQRRFAVYSSLDNFKTALLNEGIPQPNPRMKSNPGGAKKPGILDFGARRARANKEQTLAAPLSPIPPKPNQQVPSAPYIEESKTIEMKQPGGFAAGTRASASPNSVQRPVPGESAAQSNMGAAAAGAAAGMLAAGSLEGDDDALYSPPAPLRGGPPAPIAQGSATPTGPANGPAHADAPAKPPQENRPAPGIIAFPSATPSTSKKAAGAANPRGSGKLPATPGANPRGSGKLPAALNSASSNAAPPPTRSDPANVPGNGAPGSTVKLNDQGTPDTGNTGKVAAMGAAGLGAAAIAGSAGAAGGASGGIGSPAQPVNGVASTSAASSPAPKATGAGRSGGAGTVQRPPGLTPLPPPYSRRARRRRNRILLLLGLLILLCGLAVAGIFAQRGQLALPGLGGSVSATVTLTPASKLEADSYVLAGISSGVPDPTRLQISARLLTQTSATSSATANATGSIQPTRASGPLKFFNANVGSITLAGTTLHGKSGTPVSFNGPITIPGSGTLVITGLADNTGSNGNIQAGDISGPCCFSNISVNNPSAFSGGQNAQPNSVIQQSDIDNAAHPLVAALSQSTQSALQKQIKSNERVVDNTFQCKPTTTSSEQAGAVAKTATVQVSVTCTEQVYDFVAAQQIATSRLQTKAQNDSALSSQYALDGQIVTNILHVTVADNQVNIEVQAQGLWVYGFTAQMQQNLKQSLVKLSKADAQSVLLHDMGVAAAKISISSGNSMPANASDITLVIQKLPGVQATTTPGAIGGSPTTLPTSASSTPTPVNGLGGS